jgi:hypothetical protein
MAVYTISRQDAHCNCTCAQIDRCLSCTQRSLSKSDLYILLGTIYPCRHLGIIVENSSAANKNVVQVVGNVIYSVLVWIQHKEIRSEEARYLISSRVLVMISLKNCIKQRTSNMSEKCAPAQALFNYIECIQNSRDSIQMNVPSLSSDVCSIYLLHSDTAITELLRFHCNRLFCRYFSSLLTTVCLKTVIALFWLDLFLFMLKCIYLSYLISPQLSQKLGKLEWLVHWERCQSKYFIQINSKQKAAL